MKRFILLFLTLSCLSVSANELSEDYFDIATNYCIYGKYEQAIKYIDKILQIEPENTDVKELKNTLLRVMNPNIESYLTTTNSNLNKAFAYKKAGDRVNQIKTLTNTNDFWSNYFLAEYYKDNADFDNAKTYYQRAITLKPNHAQSYLGLGQVYAGLKEFQNAIDTYTKYLTYNRESDVAYALRADANLNMGYIFEAESDIKNAIQIEENIAYLLLEAKILYHKGHYDEARQMLTLLARNVQTSEVYKYLGMCDYAQNDYINALINFDKAIILSDEDKELTSAYNDIKTMLDKK